MSRGMLGSSSRHDEATVKDLDLRQEDLVAVGLELVVGQPGG